MSAREDIAAQMAAYGVAHVVVTGEGAVVLTREEAKIARRALGVLDGEVGLDRDEDALLARLREATS